MPSTNGVYWLHQRCPLVSIGPEGVLPEKLGRCVRPASENPYPIYDQNLRYPIDDLTKNLMPYL